MVVKTRKFRLFSARGGIPYLDFDYFCKTILRERNGFYRRDVAAASLHKTEIITLTFKN